MASVWGFLGRLAPSPPSAARRRQDAASRGFSAGTAVPTPSQPAPGRESLSGGRANPAPAPGVVGSELARLRCDRTLEAWYVQVKGHFLPPTSSFNRDWQTTGVRSKQAQADQITAGAPGKQAEGGAQIRLASSVLANKAMFST